MANPFTSLLQKLGLKKAPEGVVQPQPGAPESGGMPINKEVVSSSPLGAAPLTPEGGMPAKTETLNPGISLSSEVAAPASFSSPETATPAGAASGEMKG